MSPLDTDTVSIEELEPPSLMPRPFLFLVLRRNAPLAPSARYALHDVDVVEIRRGEPGVRRKREPEGTTLTVEIPDPSMSSAHVRLRRQGLSFTLEDLGSKNGTSVNGIGVDRATLVDGDLLELGCSFFSFRRLRTGETSDSDGAGEMIGTLMPALQTQLATLARMAASDVSILFVGETGTGKEVLARAVHERSRRRGRLVPVNCGALTANLVEGQLFGHRRGAFSGATEDRPGLVRASDEGTLFLDEVGELPPPAQTTMLRVLQEREVLPVGSTHPIPVDLRVICATNRDLHAAVEAGSFRPDLLARVAGLHFRLPPLRERREDIGLLVATLLTRLAPDRAAELTFTAAAARHLLTHDWPFNVRELEKVLSSAVTSTASGPIDQEALALAMPERPPGEPAAAGAPLALDQERLRAELVAMLAQHDGNISSVARAMGKDRVQIRRWIRRFGLQR